MNCPSCNHELGSLQMVCPRCGYLPGFGTDETLTPPAPDAAGTVGEPVGQSGPAARVTPPVSPWADPDAAWHSVSPARSEVTSAATPPEFIEAPHAEAEPIDAMPQGYEDDSTVVIDPSLSHDAGAPAPEPTLAFGSPQEYLAAAVHQPSAPPAWAASAVPGQPTADWRAPVPPGQQPLVWGAPGQPAPAPKRRLLVPILLLSFAVLVAGGGVAVAGYFLGWFASGPRPSDVMPATTAMYAQVDLNPSLAQKAGSWEYFRDLPEVKKAVAAGQPDPKRMIWDAITTNWGPLADVDYDVDVKPWLGDRIGFGILLKGTDTTWVTAIQVTDEAKAASQIRKWIGASQQGYEVTTRNGFAVVTTTPFTSFVLGELDKGSLSKNNEHFSADLRALGDPGILSGWVDYAAAQPAMGANALKGRAAFALRFSADTMNVDGRMFGLSSTGANGSGELGNLPATTGAAVSISGGAASLKLTWPSLDQRATAWLTDFGLEQADVEALLGRNFSVSMPTSSASGVLSGSTAFGLRVVSDDVTRAEEALRKLASSSSMDIQVKVDGDVLTAATTPAYLDELTGGTSRLSSSPDFSKAVPDHAKATAAFYVNLVPLLTPPQDSATNGYSEFQQALRGLGGEYIDEGSGNGSWSVRLVRS